MSTVPGVEFVKCQTWGHLESDGKIVFRDILFSRRGRVFSISVGTSTYLEGVRQRNLSKEPDMRADENIYEMAPEELVDETAVCRRLHKDPFWKLKPYITEQKPSE